MITGKKSKSGVRLRSFTRFNEKSKCSLALVGWALTKICYWLINFFVFYPTGFWDLQEFLFITVDPQVHYLFCWQRIGDWPSLYRRYRIIMTQLCITLHTRQTSADANEKRCPRYCFHLVHRLEICTDPDVLAVYCPQNKTNTHPDMKHYSKNKCCFVIQL